MSKLELYPIRLNQANTFVEKFHRHHKPLKVGGLFAIGARKGDQVVGVVLVGIPAAIADCDGYTVEVRRLATDGTKNACSFLLRAAWKASRSMGYRRLITFTLPSEGGASLRAAAFICVGIRGGGTWNRPNQDRIREDKHPTQKKFRWEVGI